MGFLGNEDYENQIVGPFDSFLHESFSMCRNSDEYARTTNLLTGPEVRKSRVLGILGSKENSPGAEDHGNLDVCDSEDKGPESRVPNSGEQQKTLISAVVSQFQG
jgi:hypothetical protein